MMTLLQSSGFPALLFEIKRSDPLTIRHGCISGLLETDLRTVFKWMVFGVSRALQWKQRIHGNAPARVKIRARSQLELSSFCCISVICLEKYAFSMLLKCLHRVLCHANKPKVPLFPFNAAFQVFLFTYFF